MRLFVILLRQICQRYTHTHIILHFIKLFNNIFTQKKKKTKKGILCRQYPTLGNIGIVDIQSIVHYGPKVTIVWMFPTKKQKKCLSSNEEQLHYTVVFLLTRKCAVNTFIGDFHA